MWNSILNFNRLVRIIIVSTPLIYRAQVTKSDSSQVLSYAHDVISTLCKPAFYGRGYIKKGLSKSQRYLEKEFIRQGLKPLFGNSYKQSFQHPIVTFPKNISLKINGSSYRVGFNILPDPSNNSVFGTYNLTKTKQGLWVDSIHNLKLIYKRKLTHSLSTQFQNSKVFYVNDSLLLDQKELICNIKQPVSIIPNYLNYNLGAVVSGRLYPDSFIVITAHYDHLGGIGSNVFFPGANDNASGVSMVLNLMRYFKAHPLPKSIAFVFFSGEEAGLLGSRFFTEHSPFLLKNINTLINLDLLGNGSEGCTIVNGSIYRSLMDRIIALSAPYPHLNKQMKSRGKAANSDHYWFSEKGVRSLFFYTMGGVSAYHDPFDVHETLPLTAYFETFELLKQLILEL